MTAIGPGIGGADPGFGLRVRKDSSAATATADYRCPCGEADRALGDTEVRSMVARWEHHQLNDCPIPEVRAAARSRAARRAKQKGR